MVFILTYPIKQFNLIQQENSRLDKLFNYELFDVLPNTHFEAYTRYLSGKKISKILSSNSKVISWQEFQNLEKTFYRAIRESNNKIIIEGNGGSAAIASHVAVDFTKLNNIFCYFHQNSLIILMLSTY